MKILALLFCYSLVFGGLGNVSVHVHTYETLPSSEEILADFNRRKLHALSRSHRRSVFLTAPVTILAVVPVLAVMILH